MGDIYESIETSNHHNNQPEFMDSCRKSVRSSGSTNVIKGRRLSQPKEN